jgi:hypothetical protein
MEQPKQFLTQDQIALIKKPLPKEAVTQHPTKQNLSTIKAIYVTERLNDVFGIGSWIIETNIVGDVMEKIRTTSSGRERTEYTAILKTCLSIPDYGIYYESIASSVNDDPGDACKGATTDAITKICSYIGIGIDVFKGQHDAALNSYQNESVTKYIDAVNKFDTKDGITEFAKTLPDDVKMNPTFRKAVSDKLKSL